MTIETIWQTITGVGASGWIVEKIYDYIMSRRHDDRDEKKRYMLQIIELLTPGEASSWKKKPSQERYNAIFTLANKMEKYKHNISFDLRSCANNWHLSRRTDEGEFSTNYDVYEKTLENHRKEAEIKGDALLTVARRHV